VSADEGGSAPVLHNKGTPAIAASTVAVEAWPPVSGSRCRSSRCTRRSSPWRAAFLS